MQTSITVQIKTVYGVDKIYPMCETSRIFAQMTGCKTLTDQAMQYIKQLGYGVNVLSAHNTKGD